MMQSPKPGLTGNLFGRTDTSPILDLASPGLQEMPVPEQSISR